MFRVLVGMIFHETNTFSPFATGLPEFHKRSYVEGNGLSAAYRHTHTVLGAYIETLEKEQDCVVLPSFAAAAEPSGIVEATAIETMKAELLKPLGNETVDGVLLALHGAMVTESSEDGDGDILQAVREAVGPDVPIIATLDLHTNLTQKMVDCADALVPYNEYPHADMYERGLVAANLMLRTLRGEIRPCMRWKQLPLLLALTGTGTEDYRPIREAIQAAQREPTVLVASPLHGFYLADTADTGASALAVTDKDPILAQRVADELANRIWSYRDRFVHVKTYTPAQALEDAATQDGPVVFADICDNPGAGSACDGTNLLRDLLDAHATGVAYALIVDPETVEQCHAAGVGSCITVRLGGKRVPERLGAPIECRACVKTLSDGRYTNRGPMHGGLSVNLSKTAVIVVEGITVIVSTVATQAYDVEIFQRHGLMLSDYKILVVKSSVHYRAAFGPVSKKMYSVECPGMLVTDPKALSYRNCVRRVYPLASDAVLS